MKKIMILGAGIYQMPLIKKAKEMGVYTIVVSIPGNYPGFMIADKVYYEDTTDCEKVLEIAREEKIDGIATTGTDVAVITIGYVCDCLHLSGLSRDAAEIATNKYRMKTAYEKNNVRTARFRQSGFHINDVMQCVFELRFPLMFKAVDTSGSRGIIKVTKIEDVEEALVAVKAETRLDYFIIEEFIMGTEFGAQAYVQDGKVQFVLPHGDYVYMGNTGVPVGHYVPYQISDEITKDVNVQLQRAVTAMKLNSCAINADFILSEGKVYVLEIGGRCGATCLAELVSIYYGYDYYEKMVLAALGEKVNFLSRQHNPNASHLLMSEKNGQIVKQSYEGEVDDERIVELHFDYEIGDNVREFRVGPDRIGHVITKGETLEEAIDVLEKTMKKIKITIG